MSFFIHLFFGFIMSFVGLLPPGMMNMTVVNFSIKSGTKPAIKFAIGASMVVGVQALIALSFARFLNQHPEVVVVLKKLAILIFLILSYFFFNLARRKFEAEVKESKMNYFLGGIAMSSMNMLAIPFFLGYSTIMEMKGWLTIDLEHNVFFTVGALFGSFCLFLSYAYFANYISQRVAFIAKNINYILSVLFLVLAIMTAFQVFSS